MSSTRPFYPKPRGGPAPGIAGHYKHVPEDFEVEEVPQYAPSGEGTHVYAYVEKRGLSTMDVVTQIAKRLDKNSRDIGYAGLKDAQAVTRQWLSIEHVDPELVRNLELDGARVLETTRHGNKIKIGHLKGNRFSIVIRGCEPTDLDALRENLMFLERRGVPNYFGEQRFGKYGDNVTKGLEILHSFAESKAGGRRGGRRMKKHLLRLLVSSVQSDVFNRVVTERLDTLDEFREGDIAWIHQNGACFTVLDPLDEQPRCDTFELSPTGPLPGPKMKSPTGQPLEIEARALAALDIDCALFGAVPGTTNDGARRPLRVRVGKPSAELVDDGIRIAFELPKGSYATSVLRELLADVPWFPERQVSC